MSDAAILKALRSGHVTSAEIAAHVSSTGVRLTERQAQIALCRLLDQGRVDRSKSASGYEWRIA